MNNIKKENGTLSWEKLKKKVSTAIIFNLVLNKKSDKKE